MTVGTGTAPSVGVSDAGHPDTRLLWEAYDIVRKNYYSIDEIPEKELVAGMVRGLVESLKDKHSEYFTMDEMKQFNEALSGDFEGIGAVIEKHSLGVQVSQVLAGSPAQENDVRTGDIITKANDTNLADMTVSEAVAVIRGVAGTTVHLEILRVGEKKAIDKVVTRRKINVPSVDGKILDGTDLAYIDLTIFGEHTADDFKKTLQDLYAKHPKGIILDLRYNAGGFLDTAVEVLSQFVEKDSPVVLTKERDPRGNETFFSRGGDLYKKIPMVVLINGSSASASEITAGALKDYGIAILVGENSYGKGSVQKPFVLSDQSEMKVTIAKWYTPKNIGIDKVGIKPDIPVLYRDEDYANKYDRQLEVAKDVLHMFAETGDHDKTIEFFNKKIASEMAKSGSGLTASGVLESASGKTR